MDNPWVSLPRRSPHVLPQDWPAIKHFNDSLPSSKSHCRIHVDSVIPEPFVGAVKTAPVIVLLLNPGSDETNVLSHSDPAFRKALISNLRHERSRCPFYFFDDRFGDEHPGVRWWKSKTKQIADEIGLQQLARRLAAVEWFPYKSPRYEKSCPVPSQTYGFQLVNRAIDRKATIIIARSTKRWLASVPKLKSYRNVLALNSVQNVCLTKNNLRCVSRPNANAWDMLLRSLRSRPQE